MTPLPYRCSYFARLEKIGDCTVDMVAAVDNLQSYCQAILAVINTSSVDTVDMSVVSFMLLMYAIQKTRACRQNLVLTRRHST